MFSLEGYKPKSNFLHCSLQKNQVKAFLMYVCVPNLYFVLGYQNITCGINIVWIFKLEGCTPKHCFQCLKSSQNLTKSLLMCVWL